MEYLPQVEKDLRDAANRGVEVRILMKSRRAIDDDSAEKRDEIIQTLRENIHDSLQIRAADEVLIRGCVVDPDHEGSALFLVEERGVPYVFREAAITSHPGVVKGLASMFDLIWKFESDPPKFIT